MIAGRAVAEQFMTVGARRSTTVPVAKFSREPSAALVVQPLGGDVVVAQGFTVNGDVAMTPCATRASSKWYFAAGSSVRGAHTSLSILNPFATDAVVDVEAFTENGIRAPGSLQGIDVSHGSRIVLRLDQTVAEQRIVAVAVSSPNGSLVVASQSVVVPRAGGLTSASMSLGALAPSAKWMFADNRNRSGATQQLVLANPSDADATARVSVVGDVGSVVPPRVVRVSAEGAVSVDLSHLVPAGASYTIEVDSPVPVVAETVDAYTGGLITEVGSTATSSTWWFTGGPYTATGLASADPRVPAGFDLAIVMNVKATDVEIAAVHTALAHNGHVRSVRTVTREAALTAFRAAQRDNPTLVANTTSASLPVTFDVVAHGSTWIAPLTQYFAARPGVDTVVTVANQGAVYTDDVVVFNPGPRAAVVSLVATAGGSTLGGLGMTNVEVAPLHQVTVSLVALERKGVAVVVHATGAVVAERFTGGPSGLTRSPGVP
jgi:hypothetical protein